MMVAEVLYEVGIAGTFHWSQGIKQNVALISHHHVFHTFYVFWQNDLFIAVLEQYKCLPCVLVFEFV
jgi:hypothetical protein